MSIKEQLKVYKQECDFLKKENHYLKQKLKN